jgi:uncharacterized protein (TIGR01244 family)
MSKKLLLLVLVTVLSVAACVEKSTTETRLHSETTLKVDLETVVRAGNVVPVNGVTTAGQPDAAALSIFADQGYKTVIDIRTEAEDRGIDEATIIGGLGMEYIQFPIDKPEAINFDNARELGRLIEESEGPVLVHCGSSNRVGALFALQKSLDGADDEVALEYGREAGMTRLEVRVKEVLSAHQQD